ncbi:MAG: TlpA family protein disulfide reductase [Proteobacteria bacterium]|nr:TlpA family protein disulfide reductase [Pseudomonadota bacterium]
MSARAPKSPEGVAHLASRRTFVGRLVATLSCLTGAAPAVAQSLVPPRERPPAFRSGSHQFTSLRPQRALPHIRMRGLDGTTPDLASLRGAPVLLNFWATWCAACRTELPILDALAAAYRTRGLHVLAIAQDRGDRASVERYVRLLNIKSLPVYLDPAGDIAYSDRENPRKAPFALYGMPMTYLVARSGMVIGYMPGAADWNSGEARALIAYLDRN